MPDDVRPQEAVFLTMGSVSLHGVRVAKTESSEAVMVIGRGVVGQLAATLSGPARGAPIIAVDNDDFRLDVARRRGIDHAFNTKCVPFSKMCAGETCPVSSSGRPATRR